MPDLILRIPLKDRVEVLETLASRAGMTPGVLEKDIWVCWALQAVFGMPDRLPLAFKGGTSLSKVYAAIHRFSEDIDLTIDYTALSEGVDPLTTVMSRTAIAKLSDTLRLKVAQHVRDVIAPYVAKTGAEMLGVELGMAFSDNGEELRVSYPSAFATRKSYVEDSVLLEFGGRNTTLPNETHLIVPYAAAHTENLEFPKAEVVVLSPRRSFWEKATMIHAECHRPAREEGAGPERISRHWYDLAMLAEQEIGLAAIADRDLLADVVRLKGIFYRSGFANYEACVGGHFRLVPDQPLRATLARDYAAMVSEGMFFNEPPSFDEIMARLERLEAQLN